MVELTLCKFCNCMTKTIKKKGLSGSENIHYRYECGKCGCKKEDFLEWYYARNKRKNRK